MSYYFNIIFDFITFTTILHLCISASYFPKGFFVTLKSVKPCFSVCTYVLLYLFFDTIFSKILLVNSGDVKTTPAPRKSSPITFCHQNLNGLAAHDFINVPQIEAFISTHNFNFTQTFLDSTIDLNDENINIDGYSILRADHPRKNKRGGACIYFKQSLSLIRRDYLSTMQEAIVIEILVKNEAYFFTCFYRSPSKSHDEFENFRTKSSAY